jgi:hypothetical protein
MDDDRLRASLLALIAAWREAADFEVHDMANWERATTLDQCADEVEALIRTAETPLGTNTVTVTGTT